MPQIFLEGALTEESDAFIGSIFFTGYLYGLLGLRIC